MKSKFTCCVRFVKMNKMEDHDAKEFFVVDGLSSIQSHAKLVKIYNEFAISLSTVEKWVAEL